MAVARWGPREGSERPRCRSPTAPWRPVSRAGSPAPAGRTDRGTGRSRRAERVAHDDRRPIQRADDVLVVVDHLAKADSRDTRGVAPKLFHLAVEPWPGGGEHPVSPSFVVLFPPLPAAWVHPESVDEHDRARLAGGEIIHADLLLRSVRWSTPDRRSPKAASVRVDHASAVGYQDPVRRCPPASVEWPRGPAQSHHCGQSFDRFWFSRVHGLRGRLTGTGQGGQESRATTVADSVPSK